MTTTLEAIKATQDKLAGMIAEFQANVTRVFGVPAASIELLRGEHYAGIVLGVDGAPSHHLVLMAGQADSISWDKAVEWAQRAGGDLPARSEQALLYANLKAQFDPNYYWSNEQDAANPSYAWLQYFYYGYQGNYHKSYEGRARAVRRVAI